MLHDGFMGGGIWFVWMFWLIILIIIMYIVVYLPNKNKRNSQLPELESALDILKRRYAKGEITKEEFESMKKDLS
ncbi:MAG: SHOCT domain-containing protein [Stygiobacter sp.]|jgi:putative membrane protein|uniref:SHOCT domain-containing protein n=1 Tax=Stygiobacter electus TaxID=3032292 RepID=A0AAE3P1C6_9BACT|nr:SHOCT domain-containing protein [Stygiobacter electus]MDF1612279.1 SHOCT domain-containing protein [Stygiobacter electus]